MGNSSSSRGHQDESVDYGFLVPQGVYTGPRDWNQAVVSQLIVQRKLAPFYRPLEEYSESWDDDQILAARKESADTEGQEHGHRAEVGSVSSKSSGTRRPGSLKEPAKPEAQVYRGAVECPICFLYYPPNINYSRCCDQAICTECFVQIKRAEPTTTHIVSEPAACPYCVQEKFGIVYSPPSWRVGLGSDYNNSSLSDSRSSASIMDSTPLTHKRRQKSYSAESPEVVTIDQIRPDWEAKLEAVRAAVARRANRRIIMRQVGDRLIPVGVTSGRIHALTPEEAAAAGAEGGSSGRRSRRRQQHGMDQYMGMSGQDLEELMLMEAMRLSLIDHEEQQKKEAEEKRKQAATSGAPEGSAEAQSSTPADGQAIGHVPSISTLSLSSSVPRSSSPRPPSHKSQDSLSTGRKSFSFSRSRTPPPPAPPTTVPLSEENSTAWRNRSTGPPAFSTLSAALTSTSVAAAILGSSVEPPSQSAPALTPGEAQEVDRAQSPIPTITVEINDPQTETIPLASVNPFDDPPDAPGELAEEPSASETPSKPAVDVSVSAAETSTSGIDKE